MLKLLIVGSRDFNDYYFLKEYVDEFLENTDKSNVEIVSGGANGADSLAIKYARENNIKYKVFSAKWSKYGKQAGFIRNLEMIEYIKPKEDTNNIGEAVTIAFWINKSAGTGHTIENSMKAGIKTKVLELTWTLREYDPYADK